jgi:hypothetical protein
MDGEGPEQERIVAGVPDLERPEADGTGQAETRLAGDQGQALNGSIALAQAIGSLGVAGKAERQIEQVFYVRLIGGESRFDEDGGHFWIPTI